MEEEAGVEVARGWELLEKLEEGGEKTREHWERSGDQTYWSSDLVASFLHGVECNWAGVGRPLPWGGQPGAGQVGGCSP